MIGKKRLRDVRASLLEECTKADMDPVVWFDEQIRKLETGTAANALEIETLKLIRDGLQAKPSDAKPIRKNPKPKISNRK